jgi:flagellar biosynthetic protein FliP
VFIKVFTVVLLLFILAGEAAAQPGLQAVTIQNTAEGQNYTLTIQALILMTVLTLLPAFLLMMTSFTRIVIVLAILRQAIGTAQTPSNQIVIGLSLFMTLFVMSPVLDEVYTTAVQPYMEEQVSVKEALGIASQPMRGFMLGQTRESDLGLFMEIAKHEPVESENEIPYSILMPAFVTSELKTAFQIGFLLFIPFLIIDLVVASVLMSMGMMMLSPLIISLPFKLMLFVMIDGWSLVLGTLASSFYIA